MSEFQTITDIAKANGVSDRQADYAARAYRIEPTQRVGIIRVYDASTAERIASAIRRIAQRNVRDYAN